MESNCIEFCSALDLPVTRRTGFQPVMEMPRRVRNLSYAQPSLSGRARKIEKRIDLDVVDRQVGVVAGHVQQAAPIDIGGGNGRPAARPPVGT